MNEFELKVATQKALKQAIDARMSLGSLLALQALSVKEQTQASLQLTNLVLAHRKLTNSKIAELRDAINQNSKDLVAGIESINKALKKIKDVENLISATTQILEVVSRMVVLI